MMCQGIVEASTCMVSDASFLEQQLDACMSSMDSLKNAAQVQLEVILSTDKALHNFDIYAFIASYIFSPGRIYAA